MENSKEFIERTDWLHHFDSSIPSMLDHLFMSDAVEEILITTDSKGLTLDESSQIGDIDFFTVIELGKKRIVVDLGYWECGLFSYDKVTAVIVRYHDADDVETFINEKHQLIFKR